jgi:plasmid maintenance system killer protein
MTLAMKLDADIQPRVCFRWHGEDAHDVEVADYH